MAAQIKITSGTNYTPYAVVGILAQGTLLFRRWQMWLNGPFAEENRIASEKTAKRPNAPEHTRTYPYPNIPELTRTYRPKVATFTKKFKATFTKADNGSIYKS